MSRKLRAEKPTTYTASMTKPGQALIPAELLKRHLAGTLPDIQKNPQFTHDENGHQISEDLSSLELHELHQLAGRMHEEFKKREKELAQKHSDELRKKIIEDHINKTQTAKTEEPQGTAAVPAKGDGAAG